jgi:dienelactone hydrolase
MRAMSLYRFRTLAFVALLSCVVGTTFPAGAYAQSAPLDLWTAEVLEKIRDRSTLNLTVTPRDGYFDVFFDSEIGDADWADSGEPYAVHKGDTIRIHGYLAAPPVGGPYPALVIGHGHGGHGSADLARVVAAFGYVVLSIDGPRSGLSTGGPEDTNQAWISVEETMNVPAPQVSYLYHYAYAGMRAITALDALSRAPFNPLRIDRNRFGVLGASMGGQFTYYINGIDSRVRAAVAIAAAGDWRNTVSYEGAWLYHGLYYYTRDGVRSGLDALNTVSDVCADPTMQTFLDYFDPASYAPHQHAPLLTIIGTHDQYFVAPAINNTYDKVASAGTNPRFIKRMLLTANGKHGVVDTTNPLETILSLLGEITVWLDYSFASAPVPPQTPRITMTERGSLLMFQVTAPPGTLPVRQVELSFATQMDSTVPTACDFASIPLFRFGGSYFGFVPIGTAMRCGPPVTSDNILYFASVKDWGRSTITSKLYYRFSELEFCRDFAPRIEHFPDDDFPVPPAPGCVCATPLRRSR